MTSTSTAQPFSYSNNKSNTNSTSEVIFKTILLGDSRTGKTSLINRLCRDSFNQFSQETTVIDQQKKHIADLDCILQIWDTLGQELYRSLNRIYF